MAKTILKVGDLHCAEVQRLTVRSGAEVKIATDKLDIRRMLRELRRTIVRWDSGSGRYLAPGVAIYLEADHRELD